MEIEAILSKDELSAILTEQRFEDLDRPPIAAAHRTNPFSRALNAFAEEQSRLASTIHQRPIRFSLLRVESMPVAAFSASLGESRSPSSWTLRRVSPTWSSEFLRFAT